MFSVGNTTRGTKTGRADNVTTNKRTATENRMVIRRIRSRRPSTRQQSGLFPSETGDLQFRKKPCRSSTLLPRSNLRRIQETIHSRINHPKAKILKLSLFLKVLLRLRNSPTYQTIQMKMKIHGLEIIDSYSKVSNLLMRLTKSADLFPMRIMRKFSCLGNGTQSVSLLIS
jgi:hypothetical protein